VVVVLLDEAAVVAAGVLLELPQAARSPASALVPPATPTSFKKRRRLTAPESLIAACVSDGSLVMAPWLLSLLHLSRLTGLSDGKAEEPGGQLRKAAPLSGRRNGRSLCGRAPAVRP
jgi:hypothetical protein